MREANSQIPDTTYFRVSNVRSLLDFWTDEKATKRVIATVYREGKRFFTVCEG